MKQAEMADCPICKTRFRRKRAWAKYCSPKCNERARRKRAAPAEPAEYICEESEEYGAVVAVLNPELRVICCRDNIQWICQSRCDGQWASYAFCATKEGLLMRLPDGGFGCDPEAWGSIEALPPYHPKSLSVGHSGGVVAAALVPR